MTPEEFEKAIDDAFSSGDIERAEALSADYLRAAGGPVNWDPSCPPFRAHYVAARVALGAGRPGRADELLAPLLACAPRPPYSDLALQVRLLAAEAHARCGRLSEARQLLERVRADFPSDTGMWLRSVRVRLWLREPCDLDACASALKARGDRFNLALLECEKGRLCDRAGDLPGAEECWQRAAQLSVTPGRCAIHADALLHLGKLDHLRGRFASALERYDDALRHTATGAQTLEVRLRRVLVWLDLGQWVRARSAVEGLLGPPQEAPEEVGPLAGMVHALLKGGTPAGASAELEAGQLIASGDSAGARALYLEALAAAPGPERQARLALALGLLAWSQGDTEEARSWLRWAEGQARALDLPEVLARSLLTLGHLAAEREGDEEAARPLFEEAHILTEAQAALLEPFAGVSLVQQRGGVLRHLLRAACRRAADGRGDPGLLFDYQERERGRLLLALLQTVPATQHLPLADQPQVDELNAALEACQRALADLPAGPDGAVARRTYLGHRAQLLARRDRLFEAFLLDRRRPAGAVLPRLPTLTELQRALPPGTLYLAPTVAGDEVYLLAVTRHGPAKVFKGKGSADTLLRQVEEFRDCLERQLDRYRLGLPLGERERAELDGFLDALGAGPLGSALTRALKAQPSRRLLWVPDGPLHGLPVHALRLGGRYLVEDHEVCWTFSGALFVHQARTRWRARWAFRPAVVLAERPSVLPAAQAEAEAVASTFWRGRVLPPETDRRTLRLWLARGRVVHLACHAEFGDSPLSACVHLPSGEKVHALEWLDEPVAGLRLVTLSACRTAKVGPLIGTEVFGLVTGLLGGGVRAVVAGLWLLGDAETLPLMASFYRHRLAHDLPAALALAQREALAQPEGSPLFWAAFALFGDADAVQPASRPWRWLARWRQRRHARHCAALGRPGPPGTVEEPEPVPADS
ncbi:MAG TPA: CHAT domain-containing protein [Gemmataceae bacterium]|nr:CHAT domain-containing protein [Gemmataceae bacterium]